MGKHSDIKQVWGPVREENKARRNMILTLEEKAFKRNTEIAEAGGLEFRNCAVGHYQLRGRGYILDLWPSTFKMAYGGKRSGPNLRTQNWTCRAVIRAAIDEWEADDRTDT